MTEKKQGLEKKKTTQKKRKKNSPRKEELKNALKKDRAINKHPSKYKTIDDILKEQGAEMNMQGNEIISQDQMKILLTQMVLGNVKDGFGLRPTIQERQKAMEMLNDMTKADIGEDAIDQHNESIREFELKNVGTVPDRKIEEFE